ncbi:MULTISPECIES: hypothetical protein [Herbaspirillum]|uniref:hypothetical protein n=1 Tax=Herbaspirillum TaxID=963 RepID=UPI000C0B7018|nr:MULTISPECIES: hypothetical protein [Herbaspirillum]MAF04714.1 hypothetical protein [Herbaspirillum sp.]UWE19308.1 hypothetical protein NY669_26895 [Herbaspirillum huttiense]|tara:strand:- start:33127 stop:33492 length:366 start_codon:yes stop_codon:yes gene_type:complete
MLLRISQRVSLNKISELPDGSYWSSISEYQDRTGESAILIHEFGLTSGEEVQAIDLLHIDAEGTIRHTDFMRLPTGMWRTSAGAVAADISELLAPELTDYRLVDESFVANKTVIENGRKAS